MRRDSVRSLALLNAGCLALAFSTPLRSLWASDAAPWWTVYLLWALAIAMSCWLARIAARTASQRDEHEP
jgi:hypothetical protein